jgi:hypothetical protein
MTNILLEIPSKGPIDLSTMSNGSTYQEQAAASSSKADPFTSALDHPLLVTLPGQPCSSGSSRGNRCGKSRVITVCRMRWFGGCCVPLVASKWHGQAKDRVDPSCAIGSIDTREV